MMRALIVGLIAGTITYFGLSASAAHAQTMRAPQASPSIRTVGNPSNFDTPE